MLDKQVGDLIYAGAELRNGELTFITTVNNQDSFLAKLADMMELAQSKKPASLQLVDKIASYFVAVVLLCLGGLIFTLAHRAKKYAQEHPDELVAS